MKLKLRKCDDDWYVIERNDHDNRTWIENITAIDDGDDYNSSRLMKSSRLSPESDIEGSLSEMLALASAILDFRSIKFRRCAVEAQGNIFAFWSPKNSEYKTFVTFYDAKDLANQIDVANQIDAIKL
jgi:hypothetical protein